MLNRLIIFSGIIAIMALSGCHTDYDDETREDLTKFTAQVYDEVNASILGYVYDENNHPISDADVAIYSTRTKTNKHGAFLIKNAKMDSQGTYIKVMKEGYFLGSDVVYPVTGQTATSRVQMLKADFSQSFDSKAGGDILPSNGGKIIFPADAIADSKGKPFSGKVLVSAHYLHPKDRHFGDMMPGGLLADAANGNTVTLGTLGMMAVELRSDTGEKLNLREGAQAILQFPAVTSYKPEAIEFWYFDENKGRWKEESVAHLEGDKYIASASHFSFWNLDKPFPLVQLCGSVWHNEGGPASSLSIKAEVEDLGAAFSYTNNEGNFCGKVPKGKVIKITVYSKYCNEILAEKVIGPLSGDTQMDKIFVDPPFEFSIYGQLHCNGEVRQDGIIVAQVGKERILARTAEDGSFTMNLSAFICNENDKIDIFGFDNATSETSLTLTFTEMPDDKVDLNICDSGCGFTGELVFDCDKTISVQLSNGSGNYSYLWKDNSTKPIFHLPTLQDSFLIGGIFCVTVTDNGSKSCAKTFCKEIQPLEVGIEMNCETKRINAYPHGGSGQYSFVWSNGDTDDNTELTNIGAYCLTVTDSDGCSKVKCVNFSPITIEDDPVSCSNNFYSFSSSPFDHGFIIGPGGIIIGQLTYPLKINIFEAGFDFTVSVGNSYCREDEDIDLPRLINGLMTSVVNTSCGNCNDGKINIHLDASAQCKDCEVGTVKVIKATDYTDVTSLNDNSSLSKGIYYVVVTDKNTGCYVAFNKTEVK